MHRFGTNVAVPCRLCNPQNEGIEGDRDGHDPIRLDFQVKFGLTRLKTRDAPRRARRARAQLPPRGRVGCPAHARSASRGIRFLPEARRDG